MAIQNDSFETVRSDRLSGADSWFAWSWPTILLYNGIAAAPQVMGFAHQLTGDRELPLLVGSTANMTPFGAGGGNPLKSTTTPASRPAPFHKLIYFSADRGLSAASMINALSTEDLIIEIVLTTPTIGAGSGYILGNRNSGLDEGIRIGWTDNDPAQPSFFCELCDGIASIVVSTGPVAAGGTHHILWILDRDEASVNGGLVYVDGTFADGSDITSVGSIAQASNSFAVGLTPDGTTEDASGLQLQYFSIWAKAAWAPGGAANRTVGDAFAAARVYGPNIDTDGGVAEGGAESLGEFESQDGSGVWSGYDGFEKGWSNDTAVDSLDDATIQLAGPNDDPDEEHFDGEWRAPREEHLVYLATSPPNDPSEGDLITFDAYLRRGFVGEIVAPSAVGFIYHTYPLLAKGVNEDTLPVVASTAYAWRHRTRILGYGDGSARTFGGSPAGAEWARPGSIILVAWDTNLEIMIATDDGTGNDQLVTLEGDIDSEETNTVIPTSSNVNMTFARSVKAGWPVLFVADVLFETYGVNAATADGLEHPLVGAITAATFALAIEEDFESDWHHPRSIVGLPIQDEGPTFGTAGFSQVDGEKSLATATLLTVASNTLLELDYVKSGGDPFAPFNIGETIEADDTGHTRVVDGAPYELNKTGTYDNADSLPSLSDPGVSLTTVQFEVGYATPQDVEDFENQWLDNHIPVGRPGEGYVPVGLGAATAVVFSNATITDDFETDWPTGELII